MSNKCDEIIAAAEGQIGSPYVYGTWGKAKCSVSLRKRYAGYRPSQKAITYKRCQQLRDGSKITTCDGCKYQGRLAFDCRGYTHWCLKQADIDITGGYVGRQWSDANWMVKGDVADMMEAVSCVFLADMSHTGLYVLNQRVLHCSGEVKPDPLTGGRKWAKFAIPKGLYTWAELVKLTKGDFNRMLKKGSQGADVRDMQIMLNSLGYDCGTADGIFGSKTVTAVKAFQQAEGLTVDGIAGPKTLEILAARSAQVDPDAELDEPDGPTQPELPEDDDKRPDPSGIIPMTYEAATALRDYLRNAVAILDRFLS